MIMKYCILIISLFQLSFSLQSAASGEVSVEPPKWIDLDTVDQETRLATLKNHVFISPSHFPPLYQAACDLQKLLELAGIKAIGLFGCTLGIIRLGECLSWDDDIDYGVDIRDENKIKTLIPLADKLGYNLFPDDIVGYKFYRKEQTVDPQTMKPHHVFVDVFLFQFEEDKYQLVREKGRNLFPKAWLSKREFETRTVLKCGPLTMPCSAYTRELLHKFYGSECQTKALYYFSHLREVKTYYKWTIRSTDGYFSFKDIELEDRVTKVLLPSTSFDDWKNFTAKLLESNAG